MSQVITVTDLETIKAVHRKKGLELHTASGFSGTMRDQNGSATGVVDAMLGTIDAAIVKDRRISELEAELRTRPTRWSYDQACKALKHWRREARRIAKLAGVEPREMNHKK